MMNGKSVQEYILSRTREVSKENIWNRCKKSNSLLLTAGAIVRGGYGTLVVGPGTDNMLEATYKFPNQVDGIIGNGRAILLDTKDNVLYSVHSEGEVRRYFKEKVTKRPHKPLMSAESSEKIMIMNLKPQKMVTKDDFHSIITKEFGTDIRINPPSKSRKRIRNFASKACHVREGDIVLSWKEKIPMSFEYIYEAMKPLGFCYYPLVSPFYANAAWSYGLLKDGKVNPHEPVLERLLGEK